MSDVQYLTDYELAARWRVSTQALYQRRRNKKGPPFRIIEGVPKYRLQTVERWEREGKLVRPRRRNA